LSDVPGDPKTSEVLGAVGDASAAGASLIGAGLSAAAYYSVWTLLLPVFFFLFAVRFDETLRSFERFIPTRYRDETRRLASKMDEVVGGYIRGRLVAVAFLCCGFSLGWRLVGVPYALSLGVATGVLGAVPWLAAIGWPISVALKAASVESGSIDWVTVFGLPTLVYFAVQIVENYVVTPWVQSAAMGLSPTAVLVVVLIGGAVGGAYGLLLALPAAGCLRVLASEVIFPRLEAWADSA